MINKVLDFFNKIAGLLIFLIFLILLVEHLHHKHFRIRGHHAQVACSAHPGDTVRINADSSAKK